jgi:hypothetical protein
MGLTQLSLEYQKTRAGESLEKLYIFLINQWYINTGNICGTHYDINSFAVRFNIPREFVNEFMRDTVVHSKIWDKEKQEELLNGLLGEQLIWAMEDRMEMVNQVNILKQSQGGKYTPFISSELNKALKLRLDSSASLQSIIKSMMGSGGTYNIFNQFNQQNNIDNSNNTQYISIEEARQLIQDTSKLEDKSAEIKYIESKYDLGTLPEVCATKQIGVDTSKEGLTLNKTEINAITDNYKGAIESSTKDHHEQRREIEQRIDPYEDDPELEIYDEPEEGFTPFEASNYLMPQ